VEAFRDLLHRGGHLLGEVLVFTRSAEGALAALELEKMALDSQRQQLEDERYRAHAEAEKALLQMEAQRAELATMREELERTRREMGECQTQQSAGAKWLESNLEESRRQQHRLEAELQRMRIQEMATQPLTAHADKLAQLEGRLRSTEVELEQTRGILLGERERRNRAICLIKPAPGTVSHGEVSLASGNEALAKA
jgi:SMC interacting uncharacterized protein involved in chromosome segregation